MPNEEQLQSAVDAAVDVMIAEQIAADRPRRDLQGGGMQRIFVGTGREVAHPMVFTARIDFLFGGRLIVKNSVCKQFEAGRFQVTFWISPSGKHRFAKELPKESIDCDPDSMRALGSVV